MTDAVHLLRHRLVQSLGVVTAADSGQAASAAPVVVAAAVLTCHQRDDRHVEIAAKVMTDGGDQREPLPSTMERTLLPGALTLTSGSDRAVLAITAAEGRLFSEPRLAALVAGAAAISDPAALLAAYRHDPRPATSTQSDEIAIYRALRIPCVDRLSATAEASDDAGRSTASRRALAAAVSRLMLWFHVAAFSEAEPGEFFEPMLALRHWLEDQALAEPAFAGWAISPPVATAVRHQQAYRHDLGQRLAGEPRSWPFADA